MRSLSLKSLRCAAWMLLASTLAVGWSSGCQNVRRGDSEAELALEDIAAGEQRSRLKSRTLTPSRHTIRYTVAGRERIADEYVSPAGVRAGIVLVPGLAVKGKDDPRLIAFATTLARLEYAVMVPDIASLRRLQVRTHNSHEVVEAFRYFASRHGLETGVGIAGFSYGAGPALLASLQPEIRDHVKFVVTVGGYYNLRHLVAYLTTGRYPGDAGHPLPPPHPYIERVFARSIAALVQRASDRDLLISLAAAGDDRVSADKVSARLGVDARAVYALLDNEDPNRVAELIDALPSHILSELDGLDPARFDLANAKATYILLHGRRDNLIPYLESLELAGRLPADRVELFLIDGLIHLDLEARQRDVPALIDALRTLLAQRS